MLFSEVPLKEDSLEADDSAGASVADIVASASALIHFSGLSHLLLWALRGSLPLFFWGPQPPPYPCVER